MFNVKTMPPWLLACLLLACITLYYVRGDNAYTAIPAAASISSGSGDWQVCTLEGLLSLTETSVNTITPPFDTVQHVSTLLFLNIVCFM